MTVSLRRAVLALLLVVCVEQGGQAHDISRSQSRLDVDGRLIHCTLTLNLVDLHSMPDLDRNHDGRFSYPEVDEAIEHLYDAVRLHYVVRSTVAPVETTVERYRMVDETTLRLDLSYRFTDEVTSVDVTSTLDRITQPDHRHLMSVTLGGLIHEAVLDRATPEATFDERHQSSYLMTCWNFLRLGMEHIFTGYDHLAFLVGLLIVTSTFRSLVMIITSFTVAHSITLALATLGTLVLPSRLTESLIALSIAYVAIENLVRAKVVERYRITFLFGLVHGFGFSAVLRQMQLPRKELALSLFSFNAGVEVGQLVFVAIVFPLVLYIGSSRWRREIQSLVSATVVLLSMYWFVQRAFLN